MRCRNLTTNQNATKPVNVWGDIAYKKEDDGKYSYTGTTDPISNYGRIIPYTSANSYCDRKSDYMLVMHAEHASDVIRVFATSLETVKDGSSDGIWHIMYNTASNPTNPFWNAQYGVDGTVKLLRLAVLDLASFTALQAIGLDWFDGGTAPLRGGGIRSSRIPAHAVPLDWGLAA